MIFLCDLDSTIAELTPEQQDFVMTTPSGRTRQELTWDKDYYSYLPKQKPIERNIKLALHYLETESFWILTGRNEKHREATIKWLEKQLGEEWDFDGFLLMREDEDRRLSHEVKLDMIQGIFKDMKQGIIMDETTGVVLAFEDNYQCQMMYKSQGCFIVQP